MFPHPLFTRTNPSFFVLCCLRAELLHPPAEAGGRGVMIPELGSTTGAAARPQGTPGCCSGVCVSCSARGLASLAGAELGAFLLGQCRRPNFAAEGAPTESLGAPSLSGHCCRFPTVSWILLGAVGVSPWLLASPDPGTAPPRFSEHAERS